MAKINIKLTKQQQQYLAAGVVTAVALGYCYFTFFWSPISQSIDQTSSKMAEAEGKIEKATREAARLPHLEEELATLSQQEAEAERRLPVKKSVTDILVTVSDMAEQHGVVLLTFSPGSQKSQQFFTELSYPVSVRGTFHEVGKFLAALALEERIFNIQNVVYGEANAETGEMQVTFTLISYQYKG